MDLNGKFMIMFLTLKSGTVILHFPSLSFPKKGDYKDLMLQ